MSFCYYNRNVDFRKEVVSVSNAKKQVGTVLGIGLIMAAARTALITYNMEKNSVESDVYYLPDNAATVIFAIATVLFMALSFWLAYKLGKGKRVDVDQKSCSASTACVVAAFVLIGAATIYIFASAEEKTSGGGLQNLVVIMSVLSSAAFLVSAIRPPVLEGKKGIFALITFAPLLFSVFRLLCDFINTSATPLASSGAYHISSLAVVLLYFLCEGKSYLSEGRATTYFLFGNLSVFLLLVYAVPNVIMHCFGVFCFDYSAAYSAVDISLAIYIAVRMSTARIYDIAEDDAAEDDNAELPAEVCAEE